MIWLRLLKLLALATYLCAGCIATWPAPIPHPVRKWAAFGIAGPAFGLLLTFGFVLAFLMNYSMLSLWIVLSIGCALASVQGVIFAGVKERENYRGAFLMFLLPALAAFVLMVTRP